MFHRRKSVLSIVVCNETSYSDPVLSGVGFMSYIVRNTRLNAGQDSGGQIDIGFKHQIRTMQDIGIKYNQARISVSQEYVGQLIAQD